MNKALVWDTSFIALYAYRRVRHISWQTTQQTVNNTLQFFILKTFNIGIKQAEFDADFKSVENIAKSLCKKR